MQDDTWSWVGEDGVEHHGNESQLTAALSAQRLAAYTLVTRSSWREWLPAMTVGELQWALPVGARDLVRAPSLRRNEPKSPPPMEDYPTLRLRLQALLAGTSVPTHSRPRGSIPSAPHLELSQYASDEFDEPTVQIDAEELERALNESRGEELAVPTPRSGVRGDYPGYAQDGIPLVNHEVKRRALAQRLAHKMPTYPGFAANPNPSPPNVLGSRSAPPPSPPRLSTGLPQAAPSVPNAPPTPPFRFDSEPGHVPPLPPIASTGETFTFAANESTLTSRIESTAPSEQLPKARKLWLGLVALAGTLAGAAWFITQRGHDPAEALTSIPLPSTPANLPAPSESEPAAASSCSVDKRVQVSDFAHSQVRPSIAFLPAPPRLAVGFAQTGRVAAGVTVDTETLAVTRLHSDNQASPLWSVTPRPSSSEVAFRVSRAASTLRSTASLPTTPPLFFGLNREGLAVRGDADLTDRVVWRSDWDTISVPDVAALDQGVTVVTFRAGGERGKILVGKISPQGQPLGELQTIDSGSHRIEPPSLLVTDRQVVVTYAAGDKPTRDKLFVAASPRSALPTNPKEVLRVEQGIISPSLASVPGGGYAAQYTFGVAGKQQVATVVLSESFQPQGEPLTVSPEGRDAYEGLAVGQGHSLFSFYFVRQEFGHELWLTLLTCK